MRTLLLLSLALTTPRGGGDQGGAPMGSAPAAPAAPVQVRKVDYRVVVWYQRSQPLETFKYQVYDLRKGEYGKAVEDWRALMRAKFPAYIVRVRDVELSREQGATEKLKVGAVVRRELLAAAALEGVFLGGQGLAPTLSRRLPPAGLAPAPRFFGVPPPGALRRPGSVDLSPPRPSFPVPVPYPRPHP